MMDELNRLDERVRAVSDLLKTLRKERDRLEGENSVLQSRVRKLEEAAAKSSATDAKPRLQALMMRRVEEMLAKLDVLERAVQV
jgi:DUF1365 family protein